MLTPPEVEAPLEKFLRIRCPLLCCLVFPAMSTRFAFKWCLLHRTAFAGLLNLLLWACVFAEAAEKCTVL